MVPSQVPSEKPYLRARLGRASAVDGPDLDGEAGRPQWSTTRHSRMGRDGTREPLMVVEQRQPWGVDEDSDSRSCELGIHPCLWRGGGGGGICQPPPPARACLPLSGDNGPESLAPLSSLGGGRGELLPEGSLRRSGLEPPQLPTSVSLPQRQCILAPPRARSQGWFREAGPPLVVGSWGRSR
ncbi:hypothetical protein QTO34_012357 [Cnephaeus nilssonii]|uniref:Uncharacterized protein n=1 Tax=Cnephaeus nilssonii TaxID=3371016 RepID=A0AA40HC16_CNENI|nr:hypothetical protein QTO34_012357 [Eptesicus nilssonii]